MMKLRSKLKSEDNINKISPFLAVVLGFLAGGVLMLLSGYNPITGYYNLFYGGVKGIMEGDFQRIGNILLQSTPLILSGLAVAFSFSTGVFNIGVSGQMYFGGFVAVLLGVNLDLPRIIHLPVVIIGGILGGALWALIPAILKAKYKANEVVSTILCNYISLELVTYLTRTFIPGPLETQSAIIKETASLRTGWLSNIFDGSVVNLGLFIAILVAILYHFFLNRTTHGYEMKVVGLNSDAGKYAGININKNLLLSMVISGAIAGLAGVVYYLGYTDFIQLGALPTYGFDGIAVALLGSNSAIGVILSSLLLGFLEIGGSFMTVVADIPNEIVDTIVSVIIYFAASVLLIKTWLRAIAQKESKKSKINANAKAEGGK